VHVVYQIPFIYERATITLVNLKATVLTGAERRKRLKLKRIVNSEHNYLALKKVGYAEDSFNDVQQQQENDYEKYMTNNDELPFSVSISDLFTKQDRQQ
jgi:hypothetical protein